MNYILFEFSWDSIDTRSGFEKFMSDYWWTLLIAFFVLIAIGFAISYRSEMLSRKIITIHFVGQEDITVPYGSKPILPIPEKNGYVFRGWFLDSACTIPYYSDSPMKKDLILYPKWEKEVG